MALLGGDIVGTRVRQPISPALTGASKGGDYSITLFVAGFFRFFTLIQCFDRPA